MRRVALIAAAVVVVLIVAVVAFSLSMPYHPWRTGEGNMPPLALDPAGAHATPARRVWIDADAACGAGPRIDVDDCWAILAIAQTPGIEIVGISTVHGNAPRDTVDGVVAELAEKIGLTERIYRGASEPLTDAPTLNEAQLRLSKALSEEPLTILALGPLTNIAAVLRAQPELAGRISGLVAVMGARPGHVFHPIEGGRSNMLLGHGPVFSDFNLAQDIEAVRALLDARVKLTLVPYEAARMVTITEADLDKLQAQGGVTAWAAARSRAWLAFWRDDIGVAGFYPFDLMAAVYLTRPDLFRCADVPVRLRKHTWFWRWFLGKEGLFVDIGGDGEARAVYCAEALPGTHDAAIAALTERAK
jgi:purine nucleosidase